MTFSISSETLRHAESLSGHLITGNPFLGKACSSHFELLQHNHPATSSLEPPGMLNELYRVLCLQIAYTTNSPAINATIWMITPELEKRLPTRSP